MVEIKTSKYLVKDLYLFFSGNDCRESIPNKRIRLFE